MEADEEINGMSRFRSELQKNTSLDKINGIYKTAESEASVVTLVDGNGFPVPRSLVFHVYHFLCCRLCSLTPRGKR